MARATVGRKTEAARRHPVIKHDAMKHGKREPELIESYLPAGSTQRTVAGVGAAALGALILAAMLGVGPTALAGAAGYLVYHEAHG